MPCLSHCGPAGGPGELLHPHRTSWRHMGTMETHWVLLPLLNTFLKTDHILLECGHMKY